jgi:hypothetical protein
MLFDQGVHQIVHQILQAEEGVPRHSQNAPTLLGPGSQSLRPRLKETDTERAMTGEGVESQIPTGAKGTAGFAEKNFARLLIFFACCFLVKLPLPNETPAAKFRPYVVLLS